MIDQSIDFSTGPPIFVVDESVTVSNPGDISRGLEPIEEDDEDMLGRRRSTGVFPQLKFKGSNDPSAASSVSSAKFYTKAQRA